MVRQRNARRTAAALLRFPQVSRMIGPWKPVAR
jgi:hypothetical protein